MNIDESWLSGQPVFKDGAEFEVMLDDGSIRQCKRYPSIDYGNLFFTDCTHPAQNAYCSNNAIKAWRFKEHGKP